MLFILLAFQGLDKLHFVEDALLAFQHVSGRIGRIEATGIGQRHRNQGALGLGELRGLRVEVPLSDSIGAIDAVTHLDGIQIDFHDALFRPEDFYQRREIDFKALA